MGDLYEGLLSKNSQDARSGAGQYFTPRALVDCIVRLVKPRPGEIIQDPAMGSGGFLISADHYVRSHFPEEEYTQNPPRYEGVEIEKGTYRIALMNAFLHRLESNLILGDALTIDAKPLSSADVVLANPPFGSKAGSARKQRKELTYTTTNKQLAFLQHIYLALKPGGRAAVILPDNALFEDGVGQKIRQDLMEKCNLHTILRLPTGIFYSAGVKTNVLFFTSGQTDVSNTKSVRVFDMRHDAPKYGKKRLLRAQDFSSFEAGYADDPKRTEKRKKDNDEKRWRSYSRKEISDRSDNLNFSWLSETEFDTEDSIIEPEEIAAAILDHLRAALIEIENVADELAETIERNQ